jgi:hypothetical protein
MGKPGREREREREREPQKWKSLTGTMGENGGEGELEKGDSVWGRTPRGARDLYERGVTSDRYGG